MHIKVKSKTQKLRLITQILFLILTVYITVGHYIEEKTSYSLPGIANLHKVCPFGGVVTLYKLFTEGDFVQKIYVSSVITMTALLIALIFTGSTFCGWICPLGSVQEWLGNLGRRIFKKRYNKIPRKLDSVLKFAKYFVLAWVIFQTARTGKLIFQDYDPYYNLFNIWTDEIALSGYIVVLLTVLASLVVKRPFCRYACPLGALNGLFNSVSMVNIKRNPENCIDCGLCDKVCPVGINVSKLNVINHPQCVRCMKCVDICPVNKKQPTLTPVLAFKSVKKLEKNKKVKSWNLGTIGVFLFIGAILVSIATGTFATERVKSYKKYSDIRGSSTLEEIITHFSIPKEILYKAFDLPKDLSTDVKLKDLSKELGIEEKEGEEESYVSPENIRTFVEYLKKDAKEYFEYLGLNVQGVKNILNAEIYKASMTLLEFVEKAPKGVIKILYESSLKTEEVEIAETKEANESIQITAQTKLEEIKNNIDDFDAFLKKFKLPKDISLKLTLKDLKDKYDVKIKDMKDYIEDHIR